MRRPERIVTLLPSATEIACALGLRDRLVGVTHECDYPPGVERLPHVTSSIIDHHGTSREIDLQVRDHLENHQALYHLDDALMKSLTPDLIITQALCDVCAVSESEVVSIIDKLPGPPMLINLEPMTLTEVFDTITLVGNAAGIDEHTAAYRVSLEKRVHRVRELTQNLPDHKRPTVGFLEWIDPPFNAGHWTPELIEYAGGIDVLGNKHAPSTSFSWEQIEVADPDVLVIALCGFNEDRARQDMAILKSQVDFDSLTAVNNNRVHILDGNSYFSRPGPRLVESLEQLLRILHPHLN